MSESLGARLLRKKPIEMLVSDTAGATDPEHGHLRRGITPFQLTMFGVGSTIGTGIFFGFWPARRASRLDPIEALRHE